MEAKKEIELTDRQIPGITGRQIIAYTSAVALAVFFYFRIESIAKNGLIQSRDNGVQLKEMSIENKELIRVNDARLNVIDVRLAELNIRLEILEKQIHK